jgi:uncharacterized protein YuzE
MKLHIDPEADALYLRLTDEPVEESEESAPGVVLDYDVRGEVVGIEVLGLSKRTRALTYVEVETKAA